MPLPVKKPCKPGMVARYRKTEEGGGNARKIYSNMDSKLKIVLLTELSNLAKGKNFERVLIARISFLWVGFFQLPRERDVCDKNTFKIFAPGQVA